MIAEQCVTFMIYRWAVQHEVIEKLNMQAIVNASAQEDEFVKDFLISCDKVIVKFNLNFNYI